MVKIFFFGIFDFFVGVKKNSIKDWNRPQVFYRMKYYTRKNWKKFFKISTFGYKLITGFRYTVIIYIFRDILKYPNQDIYLFVKKKSWKFKLYLDFDINKCLNFDIIIYIWFWIKQPIIAVLRLKNNENKWKTKKGLGTFMDNGQWTTIVHGQLWTIIVHVKLWTILGR